MRIDAAKAAKAVISDQGAEWRVSAPCPSCAAPLFVNVQPGPWRELTNSADVQLVGPDGHGCADPDVFAAFEAQRVAGKLEHRDVPSMNTQLWCFRCDRGVDVTLHAGD
jgi:hypothetical protein